MIWYMESSNSYTYGYEKHRFWQHLVAGGFLSGTYTGIATTSSGQNISDSVSRAGDNIPAGKLKGSGYTIFHSSRREYDVTSLGGSHFPATINNKNKFAVGANTRCFNTGVCSWDVYSGIEHAGPIFSGDEALQLDVKMDDGKPGRGLVTALPYSEGWFSVRCSTTDNPATAEYRTATDGGVSAKMPICPLFIDAGF